MYGRAHRHVATRAAALIAVAAMATASLAGTGGASRPTQKSNVLGTKNPATGTPVKVGVISNGKTPTIDNSQETPVAEATASWINDYLGGIGGHPIHLVICNDGNEEEQDHAACGATTVSTSEHGPPWHDPKRLNL